MRAGSAATYARFGLVVELAAVSDAETSAAARDALTARQLFLAGGLSGAVECLTVQPLDMAKTRLQLVVMPAERSNVLVALSGLVNEGGVFRLYRGVLPELIAMTPKSSAMYATYEAMLRAIRPSLGDDPRAHAIAGFIAGTPEALAVTPFQVVKVRLQAKEHLKLYSGTFDCVRRILATEGASALATGLHVTTWRNGIWNAVYFSLMSLRRPNCDRGTLAQSIQTLSTGFLAGVVATLFNNPFDVVKSRLQAELPRSGSSGFLGESGFGRLREIWRTEGVSGLYVGFTAKSLRMGLGGAVGMAAYEAVAVWLSRISSARV